MVIYQSKLHILLQKCDLALLKTKTITHTQAVGKETEDQQSVLLALSLLSQIRLPKISTELY